MLENLTKTRLKTTSAFKDQYRFLVTFGMIIIITDLLYGMFFV